MSVCQRDSKEGSEEKKSLEHHGHYDQRLHKKMKNGDPYRGKLQKCEDITTFSDLEEDIPTVSNGRDLLPTKPITKPWPLDWRRDKSKESELLSHTDLDP